MCDRHEADLAAGLNPLIEDRLADLGGAVHAALLRELLILEVAYRSRSGEQPTIEEYTERFPEQAETVAVHLPPWNRSRRSRRDERNAFAGRARLRPMPTIPGYHVLEELGRGGMGVVYRPGRRASAGLVALKMILAGELAGPRRSARFSRRPRPSRGSSTRRSSRSSGSASANGRPYLEMEYVDGGSLADRGLDGRPWPPIEAARLVESLAVAITSAPPGDRPPRPQAGQHPADADGMSQGRRLRAGQGLGAETG